MSAYYQVVPESRMVRAEGQDKLQHGGDSLLFECTRRESAHCRACPNRFAVRCDAAGKVFPCYAFDKWKTTDPCSSTQKKKWKQWMMWWGGSNAPQAARAEPPAAEVVGAEPPWAEVVHAEPAWVVHAEPPWAEVVGAEPASAEVVVSVVEPLPAEVVSVVAPSSGEEAEPPSVEVVSVLVPPSVEVVRVL